MIVSAGDTLLLRREGVAVHGLRLSLADPADAAALLDAGERARAARLSRPEDRARFVLGRGLLRRVVGALCDAPPEALRFRIEPAGRPRLDRPGGPVFSVSHSGDVVLVAAGFVRGIGVDVEARNDGVDLLDVAPTFLTARETAALARAPADERSARFYAAWTLKEALSKGIGTGLGADPRRFEIDIDGSAPRIRFVGAGAGDVDRGWRLSTLDLGPRCSAALAILP